MASYIVVYIENIMPLDDSTLDIQYSWNSIDGTTPASGGGNINAALSVSSSVINQTVINQAVSDSTAAGVTIGLLDRKVLFQGLL